MKPLSAIPSADAFRAAAYRVAQGVRAAEELLAARRTAGVFESDRPAWADLTEAAERLTALIAQHEPPPPELLERRAAGDRPGGAPPPRISRHRRAITSQEAA